jgi:signal transduction histidine kinase
VPLRPRSISSRQLGGLFLLSALLPSVLLVVLGWQLLRQDADLERRRAVEDREQTADAAVAALASELAAVEGWLRSGREPEAAGTGDGGIVMELSPGGLRVLSGRLLYLPVTPALAEASGGIIDAAEGKEFRDNDPAGAASLYRRLAGATDPGLRGAALIGLARVLTKAGDHDGELRALASAAAIEDASVAGIPVALLARRGTCATLGRLRRLDELRRAAIDLEHDLLAGRWPLTRELFDAQLEDLARWTGRTPAIAPAARAAADAARRLWDGWRDADGDTFNRRSMLRVGEVDLTLIAQGSAGGARVLLVDQAYVEKHWLSKVRLRERTSVQVRLERPGPGQPGAHSTRRPAEDSGLPWTVVASSVAPDASAALSPRRRLWLAGAAAMLLILFAGTYMIGRLVSRELAVARLQTDFVAAVSHEFRTPLTSLRQLAEMLIDRPDAAADRRVQYYEALQRQTERLQRLVESLLDFGRLESGRTGYTLQPVILVSLIDQITREFQEDAAARGHAVILDARGRTSISADPDAIRNAIWNLLDNAAKYSPPCSPITVSVEPRGPCVEVHVRDDGSGIPVQEQGRIFEKFVRGERAREEGVPGTGIGLAMVQQIARAHGGSVRVSSAPGAGAIFTLALPAIPDPAVEAAS